MVLEFDHLGDKSFNIARVYAPTAGRPYSTRSPSAR
jgi:hypothetical protein